MRPLDFDADALSQALERGKADALRCLDAWAAR
jgi:hypothetical protein